MLQLLQNASTGEITVDEVPAPIRTGSAVLVATRYSVISAGTERAVLQTGRASLVGKARARPDLVRKVAEAARAEGLSVTYAKVRGRLREPSAPGYSLSGVVLEAGPGAPAAPGDLVACGGAGVASHAEVVAVPRNLVARVPAGVAPQDAAYMTLGSIALHGVRLCEVGLGDVVGVVGLGLVGQITVDLLLAAGCIPVGLDPDRRRVALAREAGCTATTDQSEFESQIARITSRRGADGVLVTAASKDPAPLATATSVARERAVVCIVGDVPVTSPRAPLFAKELRLVVSRSYGPGRYDETYERDGLDYPPGYVRWTEGRNFEEVLRLMSTGHLRPSRLTTHTFPLERAPEAYALLQSSEASLGILVEYPGRADAGPRAVELAPARRGRLALRRSGRIRIGVVGAGAFARGVLMPALSRDADIVAVANATGVSARASAAQFGARLATTDPEDVLTSEHVDAVVIATRHDTHAQYARRALQAGKHVFVEKPPALDRAEMAAVVEAAERGPGCFMVGFNRRFAPHLTELADALGGRGPLVMTYRVNAGRLPASHWTHDAMMGGGRIIGEMCHFVDTVKALAGDAPIHQVMAVAVGGGSEPREDDVCATVTFGDGSVAQLVYAAFGDPALPKERLEVLGEAGAAVLDDFRELVLYRGSRSASKSAIGDKGHRAEIREFLRCCSEGRQPWPVEAMHDVMEATFRIHEAISLPADRPPANAIGVSEPQST